MATLPDDAAPQRITFADLGTREAVCAEHGPYESRGRMVLKREHWTSCPACAQARADAEEAERLARQAALERARIAQAIGEAGIPARFQGRTFETFVADTDSKRRALTIARDFAEGFKTNARTGAGLVLTGLPGTGKSHLAASILLYLINHGQLVQYLTCMAMIRAVRDTWRRDSERSEKQILRLLGEELDLLVLDEIGVQYGTEGEQTVLFEVLDRRYAAMRPTVLITNQNKDGLKTFVGDRVFDRLVETSRLVVFDWPSYRAEARRAAQGAASA